MKIFGLKNILLHSLAAGHLGSATGSSIGVNSNVKNAVNDVAKLNTMPASSQAFLAPTSSINGNFWGADCQQTVTFLPYKADAAEEALSPEFAKCITADPDSKQDASNGIGNAIMGFMKNPFGIMSISKSQDAVLPCNKGDDSNVDGQYSENESEMALGDLHNLFNTETAETGAASSKNVQSTESTGNEPSKIASNNYSLPHFFKPDGSAMTADEVGKDELDDHANNNLAAPDSLLSAFDIDTEKQHNGTVGSGKQSAEDEEVFYDAYSSLADLDHSYCAAEGNKSSKTIADFAHTVKPLLISNSAAAIGHVDQKKAEQNNTFASPLHSFGNSSSTVPMSQKDSAPQYENKTSQNNADAHAAEQNLPNTKAIDHVALLAMPQHEHQPASDGIISSGYKTALAVDALQADKEGSVQKQDIRLPAEEAAMLNARSFKGPEVVVLDNPGYLSTACSATSMQKPNMIKMTQLSKDTDSTACISLEKIAKMQDKGPEIAAPSSSMHGTTLIDAMPDTSTQTFECTRDIEQNYTSNNEQTKQNSEYSGFFWSTASYVAEVLCIFELAKRCAANADLAWHAITSRLTAFGKGLGWACGNIFGVAVVVAGKGAAKIKGAFLQIPSHRSRDTDSPAGVGQLPSVSSNSAALKKTTNSFRINKHRVAGVLGAGVAVVGVVTSGAIWYVASALGGLFSVAVGIAVPGLCIAGIGGLAIYGLPMIKSWFLANKSQHPCSNVNNALAVCSQNPTATTQDQQNETGNTQNDEADAKDLDGSDQCNATECKPMDQTLNPKLSNRLFDLPGDTKSFVSKWTLHDFLSFFNPQINKDIDKLKQQDWEKLLTCLEPFLSNGFLGLRRVFRATIFCWYGLRECFVQVGFLGHRSFSEWLAEELLTDFNYQDFNKFESVCCITKGFFSDHTSGFGLTGGNKAKAEKAGPNNTGTSKSSTNSTTADEQGGKDCRDSSNDELCVVANSEQDSKDVKDPGNFLSNISVVGLESAAEDNLSLMEAQTFGTLY